MKKVNLNTASHEEIANLPMVGDKRADFIVQNRPFHSWDDVGKVVGIGEGMVDDLKKGNAIID